MALHRFQHIRVRAELEDEIRLGATRELRVPRLVEVVAELRCTGRAVQEVGDSHPLRGAQFALKDDRRACMHGGECGGVRVVLATVTPDLDERRLA